MRFWLVLLAALGLAGCSVQAINERLTTPDERALAVRVIRATRAGDRDAVMRDAAPQLAGQLSPELFARLAASIPDGEPVLETANVQSATGPAGVQTLKFLNYELGAGNRWAVVQVILDTSGGAARLNGIYALPGDHSLVQANRLTLAGKTPLHYAWLGAMFSAVLVSLAALVLILRARGLRYKWAWALGCLVSFVTFSLDWTTGTASVQPISVLLLGAAVFQAGPLNPWLFSFAIPVLPIAFLFRYWRKGLGNA
ncbi:MAG: hypothetical protein ACOY45_06570 [Pseudomonadota bacterium]